MHMQQDMQKNIQYLKGVGEKRAQLFSKLGVDSVGALLCFYPRAYEDWSKVYPIDEAPTGENCCVKARVVGEVSEHIIRKGLIIFKAAATDEKSVMEITIFNNKYAAQKLKSGEEFLFFGKVETKAYKFEMSSPDIEPAASGAHIRPIYRQTAGLSSRTIGTCVKNALAMLGDDVFDPLPDSLRKKYKLCHSRFALENIHFPQSCKALETAKRRLIFEELLTLQLGLMLLKAGNKKTTPVKLSKFDIENFYSLLPFVLTNAQKTAVIESLSDMFSGKPMCRLIQGDVGSGKTVVAAALIYAVVKSGFQAALMAPTEILAQQHFESLHSLMEKCGISVSLLTGSTPAAEKKKIKSTLSGGELDFVIGTHALLQNDVEFKNLGLVVTDEQHRFGVSQRSALASKGSSPHVLVMSATPIPRTLALIIYGDLDVSTLNELPPGRHPIETYCVGSDKHARVYNYLKKHLNAGKQGYIVCPLVEDSEKSSLTSAQKYAEKLSKGPFKGYKVGLIHGRMNAEEKENVMRSFAAGDIQLLVATTVIEVGINVPNAVIIVIENAEQFGLSQLHQLRGRVGRGNDKSTCILISDAQNEEAQCRLRVMCQTNDGFKIANEDLKLRGPGDFFGQRQHGLPDLKIADMMTDVGVLTETQSAAKKILKADPLLKSEENSGLHRAIAELFKTVGKNGLN